MTKSIRFTFDPVRFYEEIIEALNEAVVIFDSDFMTTRETLDPNTLAEVRGQIFLCPELVAITCEDGRFVEIDSLVEFQQWKLSVRSFYEDDWDLGEALIDAVWASFTQQLN